MKRGDPVSEGAVRIEYEEPIGAPEGLRRATVRLAQRARVELGSERR